MFAACIPQYEFQCGMGHCIKSLYWYWPILFAACIPQYEFQCGMGHCIKSYQRCDELVDCPDRTDEENCSKSIFMFCKVDKQFPWLQMGARHISAIVSTCGVIGHQIDPSWSYIELFLIPCLMSYPVWGIGQIKDPLLLIRKSSPRRLKYTSHCQTSYRALAGTRIRSMVRTLSGRSNMGLPLTAVFQQQQFRCRYNWC